MYPFWINMPKLFEFYVLGVLKDNLGRNKNIFQADAKYGELEYLRVTRGKEMVIDAKYKSQYVENNYEIGDIRQLSACARDTGILKQTYIPKDGWSNKILDQNAPSDIFLRLIRTLINQFLSFKIL